MHVEIPIIEGMDYFHPTPYELTRLRAKGKAAQVGTNCRRKFRELVEDGMTVEAKLYKSTRQLIKKGFTAEYIDKQLYEWFQTHYTRKEIEEYHAVIRQHTKGAK